MAIRTNVAINEMPHTMKFFKNRINSKSSVDYCDLKTTKPIVLIRSGFITCCQKVVIKITLLQQRDKIAYFIKWKIKIKF